MKKSILVMVMSLVLLPVLAAACTTQVSGDQNILTEEQARQKAEQFVRDCPTFVFDGIEDSLHLSETLYPDIEHAWTFVFEFESRQAGYGDRTGQMLLQVITPHEATVTIEQDDIKTAILDGQWDMKTQQLID
ncbi:MAG: hypothetical protein JW954_08245 [Dehalococcoidaceae bacterium]|nr:hypothetical protein [Dehalococcoidaceae bacterium]